MKFIGNGIDCSLESKSQTVTSIGIVGFTAGKPTMVEVDGTTGAPGFVTGDLVMISGSGSSLDGKAFVVGSVTLSEAPARAAGDSYIVELRGADTTNETLVPGGSVTKVPGEVFCLSSFERQVPAAQTIDVTTFCSSESLAGKASPGTIKVKGFVDYSSDAYNEWRRAVSDGERRWLRLDLPNGIGTIVMQVTASALTETFEVNAASAFEGEAVINQEPLYIIGA